jgi:NAD(P)H-dependent FMN reductase
MKLAVIVGTVRENRVSAQVAKWVVNEAEALGDVEVELVDLIDYPMPFFDEPMSPRYNTDRHMNEVASKWTSKLAQADAYIFVTPEYNHSIPGVLKNALDYVTFELVKKPATVVSHGSVGGARAAMHLKEIISESHAVVIPTQVAITGSASERIDENGVLTDEEVTKPYGLKVVIKMALDDLKWYSDVLAAGRAKLADK